MRIHIEERTIQIAEYIIKYKSTVRDAARHFGVSKSTVHKDLIERLPMLNRSLSKAVRVVLDTNLAERHIRGGIATRQKYLGA
ncbi:MAG: sporulation transcriptional regulator SpoIIID [Clostridiales bacterium]|nr:sporulation transcriptional regulator SpoIIID [Clostridiales bacterium]